jgi:predicted permease
MTNELPDTAEALERKETAHELPVGWRILFGGLIAWGAYYLFAYSPWASGWTQEGELKDAAAGVGSNIFMTVLFTALPTAAALILISMQRRKRSMPGP